MVQALGKYKEKMKFDATLLKLRLNWRHFNKAHVVGIPGIKDF